MMLLGIGIGAVVVYVLYVAVRAHSRRMFDRGYRAAFKLMPRVATEVMRSCLAAFTEAQPAIARGQELREAIIDAMARREVRITMPAASASDERP